MGSTPSSAEASLRPSNPSWLNDLSSKPPASETMQGRKSLAAPPPSVSSGAAAQPASTIALVPIRAMPLVMRLREVILKVSSKMLPSKEVPGLCHNITQCYVAGNGESDVMYQDIPDETASGHL